MKLSVLTSCYHGEKYLDGFFKNVTEQTIFENLEVVFIHNEPTQQETMIVNQFEECYPEQIQVYCVEPVEPLAVSWNRAIELAKGDYVAIWNVDDRRLNHSLEEQVDTLDENPTCVMTYGDYFDVPDQNSTDGYFWKTPKFSKKGFIRTFPQGGAFLVWRKSLAEQIGYFDEQLLVVADYDYSIRVALNDLTMCRVPSLLGYFTDSGQGLSTRNNSYHTNIEKTVILQRYGVFDKVRDEYLSKATEYRVGHIKNFGEWRSMETLVPNYQQFIRRRAYLWKVGTLRNWLRALLTKVGLLEYLYGVQERYIKRDI